MRKVPTFTPMQFAAELGKRVALFVIKSYANPSVHRSLLTEIVNDIKDITSNIGILKSMCAANETT